MDYIKCDLVTGDHFSGVSDVTFAVCVFGTSRTCKSNGGRANAKSTAKQTVFP